MRELGRVDTRQTPSTFMVWLIVGGGEECLFYILIAQHLPLLPTLSGAVVTQYLLSGGSVVYHKR